MSVNLSWTGKESAEVVGRTRAQCYAPAGQEVEAFQTRLAADGRVTGDDLLLAEADGRAVGTATSYSVDMWVRGRAVPCQAVGWVGTVKTHRRSGGIASQVMREVLRKGRERGQVLSALMPFRASFYDHFGYGLVERRAKWTIPLSILPSGPTGGAFTFVTGVADEARRACRQRMVRAGHCEIERTPGFWDHWLGQEDQGYAVADRSADGTVRSWFAWTEQKVDGLDVVRVDDMAYDSVESLVRGLNFFATLRDQYSAVSLILPADLQLFRLLRETQVPHRLVNHDTAEVKTFTRMQVRVLDHVRLVEGLRVAGDVRGAATVAIAETEGTVSTLRVEVADGRASARASSGAADVECSDRDWAAIVLGDVSATRAAGLGLIRVNTPAALAVLDAFAGAGPAPFCSEYF